MTETPPPPDQGRVLNILNAAKGLTLFNVLVVALLVLILIPVYIVWKALSDEQLLDRFLSSYMEVPSDSGCTVRVVAERGGPERWSISSQWAAQGTEIWTVGTIYQREPTAEQILSTCQALKLIADQLVHTGGDNDAPVIGH